MVAAVSLHAALRVADRKNKKGAFRRPLSKPHKSKPHKLPCQHRDIAKLREILLSSEEGCDTIIS